MIVTPERNRRNRHGALAVAVLMAVTSGVVGWFVHPVVVVLGLCPFVFWWLRRPCLRRLAVMKQPFLEHWEQILRSHVAFFGALDDLEKERFRQLIKIFLDEVRITGIRTDVDDTIRVLVAASAVIPIFGFRDWEYHRLSEVLIYPTSFGDAFQMTGEPDENILGMVGLKHLSGMVILSKPALLAGFENPSNKENVGVHEFAHLIEKEETEHGLPQEVPWEVIKHWIQYVARELAHPPKNRSHINSYAYTNEHEYFAVLTAYFFKSPDVLKKHDPDLYRMLRDMFHQDRAVFSSWRRSAARATVGMLPVRAAVERNIRCVVC
jgi:MtfA peptidase